LSTVWLARGVANENAPTSAKPQLKFDLELSRIENVGREKMSAPVPVTFGRAMPHAGGPSAEPQRRSRNVRETRPQQQVDRG
jgi:hypothetical protein